MGREIALDWVGMLRRRRIRTHLNPLAIRSRPIVYVFASSITTHKADRLDPRFITKEVDGVLATVNDAEDTLWDPSHDCKLG